MGTDYSEKEREFISSLAVDTGKDLNGWMSEISNAKLASRNDIIDWLRHRGFTFAKASWLERIFHNGGRLIYADDPTAHSTSRVSSSNEARPMPPTVRDNVVALKFPRPVQPVLATTTRAVAPSSTPPTVYNDAAKTHTNVQHEQVSDAVKSLLVTAKGLRPLAEHIVREIARTVPGTNFSTRSPLIVAEAPQAFVALWPTAKMLKLYGNFGATDGARVAMAEPIMKAAPPFPHVIALDDARLVDQNFRDLIYAAAARAKV